MDEKKKVEFYLCCQQIFQIVLHFRKHTFTRFRAQRHDESQTNTQMTIILNLLTHSLSWNYVEKIPSMGYS